MSGEEAETTGETEEGEAEEEEEEEVQLPTVEVPEMMSEEVSVRGRGRARGAGGESDRTDFVSGFGVEPRLLFGCLARVWFVLVFWGCLFFRKPVLRADPLSLIIMCCG